MPFENSIKALQVAAAALGISAAAAGTYSAYQTFFSNDATCHKLRVEILAIMERNVPVESKHTLLRRDVAEFHRTCGKSDPEATSIFQAALRATEPVAAATAPAAQNAAAPAAPAPPKAITHVGLFGGSGPGEQQGWVAISRRAQLVGLGAQLHRLCDFRNVVAAPRHGLDRAATAVGLVRSADRSKRREQIASRLPKGACVRVIGRAASVIACGPRLLRRRARSGAIVVSG